MLDGLTPPKSNVHRCKIATSLQDLDASDSQILADAVNDIRKWPAQTLATELRKKRLVISDGSITRHRKKTCACYREIG